jgi:Ca2+-binding EF-hand superfamily protein
MKIKKYLQAIEKGNSLVIDIQELLHIAQSMRQEEECLRT